MSESRSPAPCEGPPGSQRGSEGPPSGPLLPLAVVVSLGMRYVAGTKSFAPPWRPWQPGHSRPLPAITVTLPGPWRRRGSPPGSPGTAPRSRCTCPGTCRRSPWSPRCPAMGGTWTSGTPAEGPHVRGPSASRYLTSSRTQDAFILDLRNPAGPCSRPNSHPGSQSTPPRSTPPAGATAIQGDDAVEGLQLGRQVHAITPFLLTWVTRRDRRRRCPARGPRTGRASRRLDLGASTAGILTALASAPAAPAAALGSAAGARQRGLGRKHGTGRGRSPRRRGVVHFRGL